MRRVPFYPLLVTALVSLGGYLGCSPDQVEQELDHIAQHAAEHGAQIPGLPVSTSNGTATGATATGATATGATATGATARISMPQRSASTLIVGSFNMQRLGPTKLADRWVMEHYADIIRRFDVIALQEVTSSDPNTLPALLQYVNANGSRYSYTISPPIGRTARYTEQYAYVFDTSRVMTRADACFVMRDEEDLLHREPFVGRFATLSNTAQPFTFVLINMHTDPDEIDTELDTLASVYVNVADFFYNVGSGEYPEDDVMLLGDLNADPTRFRTLGQVPNLIPAIVGIPTNYTRSKTNDNILINRVTTREFTGRSGALDLQDLYAISQDEAHRISDHQPVWAEFYIQEAVGNQVAAQPGLSYMR